MRGASKFKIAFVLVLLALISASNTLLLSQHALAGKQAETPTPANTYNWEISVDGKSQRLTYKPDNQEYTFYMAKGLTTTSGGYTIGGLTWWRSKPIPTKSMGQVMIYILSGKESAGSNRQVIGGAAVEFTGVPPDAGKKCIDAVKHSSQLQGYSLASSSVSIEFNRSVADVTDQGKGVAGINVCYLTDSNFDTLFKGPGVGAIFYDDDDKDTGMQSRLQKVLKSVSMEKTVQVIKPLRTAPKPENIKPLAQDPESCLKQHVQPFTNNPTEAIKQFKTMREDFLKSIGNDTTKKGILDAVLPENMQMQNVLDVISKAEDESLYTTYYATKVGATYPDIPFTQDLLDKFNTLRLQEEQNVVSQAATKPPLWQKVLVYTVGGVAGTVLTPPVGIAFVAIGFGALDSAVWSNKNAFRANLKYGTKVILASIYALQNHEFNKCLASKNPPDPYAIYNDQLAGIFKAGGNQALDTGSNLIKGGGGACDAIDGGVMAMASGKIGSSILSAICNVVYIAYQNVGKPFFDYSVKLLTDVIGLHSNNTPIDSSGFNIQK